MRIYVKERERESKWEITVSLLTHFERTAELSSVMFQFIISFSSLLV